MSGMGFFVFVFLGLIGSVSLLAAAKTLLLPTARTEYVSVFDCEDAEYRVRCALAESRGEVVVVLPEGAKKDRELLMICRGLLRDEPRLRLYGGEKDAE